MLQRGAPQGSVARPGQRSAPQGQRLDKGSFAAHRGRGARRATNAESMACPEGHASHLPGRAMTSANRAVEPHSAHCDLGDPNQPATDSPFRTPDCLPARGAQHPRNTGPRVKGARGKVILPPRSEIRNGDSQSRLWNRTLRTGTRSFRHPSVAFTGIDCWCPIRIGERPLVHPCGDGAARLPCRKTMRLRVQAQDALPSPRTSSVIRV
jgi:hypothetical protein